MVKNMQNRAVTQDDLENIERIMKTLVKRDEFKDLASDVSDCATKQDLSIIQAN